MSLKAVLFDLDGTLLPLEQDEFIKEYFVRLAQFMAKKGYDPQKLINAVRLGTDVVLKNDGAKTNEEVFWQTFSKLFGEEYKASEADFYEFYVNEFDKIKASCGYNSKAKETVEFLKSRGVRLILATNPVFPEIATKLRIGWAGLSPEDFELITTYENSTLCKPNTAYYADILNRLDLKAEECIMVGNDAKEDTAAELIGIKVFLLTDRLLNRDNRDISKYPQGGFEALNEYLMQLFLKK